MDRTMDGKNEQGMKEFLVSVAMFFITPIFLGFASYLQKRTSSEIMRNIIMSIGGVGILLSFMEYERKKNSYLFENKRRYVWLGLFYCIGLILVCLFPYIPLYTHPYMALGVFFILFSNFKIGILGTYLFLMYGSLLCDYSVHFVLFFTLTTFIGGILFYMSGFLPKAWLAYGGAASIYATLFVALDLLFARGIGMETFKNPLIGLVINLCFLFFGLLLLETHVKFPYRKQYEALNNPKGEFLSQLKEMDEKAYDKAMHTGYLSKRVAGLIGLDEQLAQAGGYYHPIGRMKGRNPLKGHKFPPPLIELLASYSESNTPPHSKVGVILIVAEAIVSSVLFLLEKEQEEDVNYKKVVRTVFQKMMDHHMFDEAEITTKELHNMQELFLKEASRYDFSCGTGNNRSALPGL